ncbi:MAG: hypothetical protein RBQ94_02910 [Methanimicrococcus sp.]|nr:hypothetical protein [Methanimicrococcus sp.]
MRCVGEPAFFEGKKEPRSFERQNGILYHYFEESELKDLFEKNGFETLNFQSLKKEKRYGGENYIRHHYRAVFKKN